MGGKDKVWPLGSHNSNQDKKKSTHFEDPPSTDADRVSKSSMIQEKDPKAQKSHPTSEKSSSGKKKGKKAKGDKGPAPEAKRASISDHRDVWKTSDAVAKAKLKEGIVTEDVLKTT